MIAYKYLKVVEQNQHNPASRKSRGQGAGETVLCPPTICQLEVNFSLMMGITNLTFISDLIPHRGKWGRTQIYSVHFMVALVRASIYLFIKKKLYHQNNTRFSVSEHISTQGNILHAEGKDGENKYSKEMHTDVNQKEYTQSFL